MRGVTAASGLCCLLIAGARPARGSADDDGLRAADAAQVNLGQQYPISSLTELHQVVVTLQQQPRPASRRHDEEKSRLLGTLDRHAEPWTYNHPRYRLLEAVHGFLKYHERQAEELARLRGLYKSVTRAQKAFLEHNLSYSSKFDDIDRRLAANQALCDDIVRTALDFYGVDRHEVQRYVKDAEAKGHAADKVSVSQALKHIVRDWTDEGDHERNSTFACLLGTLEELFPQRDRTEEAVRVLLPGAGLGRLGFDIHRLGGFQVTINEWSMFMNVVYRFIEAHGQRGAQALHPFVDGWSHHATDANMRRRLAFPDVDVDPRSVLMMEGDFTTIFREHEGAYDVVVTYFFIDTARNLMAYFDTIKHVLRTGGVWLNLGPLLYGTGPFVQLSLEDIVKVAQAMGFQFLDTDDRCGPLTFRHATVRSIEGVYGFDKLALTKNSYNAQFWAARKL